MPLGAGSGGHVTDLLQGSVEDTSATVDGADHVVQRIVQVVLLVPVRCRDVGRVAVGIVQVDRCGGTGVDAAQHQPHAKCGQPCGTSL